MLTLKSRSGCGRVNYSQHLGFDQNTVQGLENVNRISGVRQKLDMDAGLGRKTIFGIAMTEVCDAGFSWEKNRNAELGSPSQNLVGVTSHKHRNVSSVCGVVRGDKIATLRTDCYIFYSIS